MSIRHTAFAGTFYPGNAGEISDLLQNIAQDEQDKVKKLITPLDIIGGIVTHAGYKYSASEAYHFFHFLQQARDQYDTFIIINPCHQGYAHDISLDTHEKWNTPIGDVMLDFELMDFMNIPRSGQSQLREHSAEVIVPYLQYFLDYDFKILPVSMYRQNYKFARQLAEIIYKANQVMKRKIAIIASSDFSHQVRPEEGFYYDNLVINRILNNSIRGLYDTVNENNISVCGYGPIMALMFYSRMIDSNYKVEILARGNSAKKIKTELVVDYVSALFYQ